MKTTKSIGPIQIRRACVKHATVPRNVSYRNDNRAHGIAGILNETKKIVDMTIGRGYSPVRNGKWKEFNKHAVLIAEGHFVNSKKHGLWREYYDSDGGLMIEEMYRHGVSHGKFTSYHPNGKLLSEGQFRNGLREGHFRIYDDNGTNIKNIFFINDREIDSIEQNHKTAG